MRALVRDIIPQSAPRRPHKYWVPFAWMVRMLVEAGMGISDAVRTVLRNAETEVRPRDVASLRVVFYKIRTQEWPEGMLEMVAKAGRAVGDHSGGSDDMIGDADEEPDVGLTEEERRELAEEEARVTKLGAPEMDFTEVGTPAEWPADPDADPDFQPEEFEV